MYVDHCGNLSVAQSLAQMLNTDDRVVALFGAYQSPAAMTATAVAERYGVPFVVADPVASNIMGRRFKSAAWFSGRATKLLMPQIF